MSDEIVIRPEREPDYAQIADVVRGAFVRHPDEVAKLVDDLRASENYIPELALVAEDATGVVAHVMLTWIGIDGGSRPRILCLSPMSVRPDRQRAGVGSRLIRDVLDRADAAGEPAVILEGIPAYYPRFGFERATEHGFLPPREIPAEAFMVKRLSAWTPDLGGQIVYPPAFDAVS